MTMIIICICYIYTFTSTPCRKHCNSIGLAEQAPHERLQAWEDKSFPPQPEPSQREPFITPKLMLPPGWHCSHGATHIHPKGGTTGEYAGQYNCPIGHDLQHLY